MAARLRVEQFKIGAFARQGGGQRQIVGFKEIVAAGDDEQGWQIDVERQTLSGEELRIGGFEPRKEIDAQHLLKTDTAVRVIPDRQLAAHGLQRRRTVRAAHRSGTRESDAGRLVDAKRSRGFRIVSMAKVSSVNAPPAESPVRNTAFGLTG